MKYAVMPVLSGVALAMAAAGCASNDAGAVGSNVADNNSTDLVHCYGVNACGGHNDCATADHACAGQGSCKATGFVGMPSKACADVGGEVGDEWRGTIAKADLVHCYGVNVCGGHNDCATAEHACAGQGSCKGTGFVGVPEKACSDIGGKVGV